VGIGRRLILGVVYEVSERCLLMGEMVLSCPAVLDLVYHHLTEKPSLTCRSPCSKVHG
jgi:hypothetical protein